MFKFYPRTPNSALLPSLMLNILVDFITVKEILCQRLSACEADRGWSFHSCVSGNFASKILIGEKKKNPFPPCACTTLRRLSSRVEEGHFLLTRFDGQTQKHSRRFGCYTCKILWVTLLEDVKMLRWLVACRKDKHRLAEKSEKHTTCWKNKSERSLCKLFCEDLFFYCGNMLSWRQTK